MQSPQPTAEHIWLQKLVGEWTVTMDSNMGPDQPPFHDEGTETVRSMGGLWTIADGTNTYGTSQMTLGYDPAKGRFVGSFIASMMTFFWSYDGVLEGNTLTLNATGPSFANDGTMVQYQDIIEFVDDNTRFLRARMLKDGVWVQFMEAKYTRQ